MPIWLPSLILLRKIKDRAWTHTVYFALRLLLPIFIPFHWIFSQLLNLYYNLTKDIFR